MPSTIRSIGKSAFYGHSNLKKVDVADIAAWGKVSFGDAYSNPLYYAHALYHNGIPVTNLAFSEGTTEIEGTSFANCTNIVSITIPSSVTNIAAGAFSGDSALSAVGISDIAAWCQLSFQSETANPLYYAHMLYLNGTSSSILAIPDGVKNIGQYAFAGCTNIIDIAIPNNVTNIGAYAFEGCRNLVSLELGDGIASIEGGAFSDCSAIEEVRIPSIETWLNVNFKPTSGRYPDYSSNPLINAKRLYVDGAEVSDIDIPASIKTIPDYSFYNFLGIINLRIPASVRSVGVCAFSNCKRLEAMTIGENATRGIASINASAFQYCTNLSVIAIGNSVTNIDRKSTRLNSSHAR